MIITWIVNAAFFLLLALVVPGIEVASLWTALVLALLWGLLSVTLRPILLLLTLPINLVTLGLFTFVLNALLLLLLDSVVKGFSVSGFGAALLGAIFLAVLRMLYSLLIEKTK
jgi:putative membrane protein